MFGLPGFFLLKANLFAVITFKTSASKVGVIFACYDNEHTSSDGLPVRVDTPSPAQRPGR